MAPAAAPRRRSPPAFLRRLGVGVVDQLCSSGTNFLATLGAARLLPAIGFGAFSIVIVSYLFALGLNRGLVCEAILVRPGEGPDERRSNARRTLTASLLVGLVGTGIVWTAAALTDGVLARLLLVGGAFLPVLLAQDSLRYSAFSREEPGAALVSDGVWLLGQLVAFGLLIALPVRVTAPWVLVCWAVPGGIGFLAQALRDRVAPRLRSGLGWVLEHRDLGLRYGLDYLSLQGAGHVGTYAVMVISGLGAVGAIRGAQTLYGPLSILLMGTYLILVPEGRRAVERSKPALTKMCVAASLSFMVAAFVVLGLLLSLSPTQGHWLLGRTWEPARAVLFPIALANALGGIYAGATAGLRAMAAARSLLRVRLMTMPTTVALPLIGAVIGDAAGMAYGWALAEAVAIVFYLPAYRRELEAYQPASPTERVDEPTDFDEPAPMV